MLFKYKDKHLMSNSIDVFNIYKRLTGRSLEKDLINIKRRDDILKNPEATEAEVDKALDMVDPTEIVQMVYAAMRLDAEPNADLEAIIKEVEIEDLQNGSLQGALEKLISTGKKNATGLKAMLMKR